MAKSITDGEEKIFVIDTNILIDDPNAIARLKDNIIVIPFSVLDELDGLKKRSDELGNNARRASRFINKMKKNGKSLSEGVAIYDADGNPTGGTLYLDNEIGIKDLSPLQTHNDTPDHRIMSVALKWKNSTFLEAKKLEPDAPVILITNDINLRNKADSFGIIAEWRKTDKVSDYTGSREISDGKLYNLLEETGVAANSDLNQENKYSPNECLLVRRGERFVPAIFRENRVEAIKMPNDVYGVKPRNIEQQFALELLLDPKIRVVTINGKAGTGKTLLALAASLQQLHEDIYDRVAVARPIVVMGNDIGFLPGNIEEKLNPWMQPIYDNLDILFPPDNYKNKHAQKTKRKGKRKKICGVNWSESEHQLAEYQQVDTWQKLIEEKLLCVEPLAYMRGRSMPRQILIIDEAQNLNRHEVKTIITRIGEGSKIILTGDIEQIDNPYLNKNNNGLSIAREKLKNWYRAGHISLKKSERSEVAEYVSSIL